MTVADDMAADMALRHATLDALEAIAAEEAKAGDGRALRMFKRLRAEFERPSVAVKPRPTHTNQCVAT